MNIISNKQPAQIKLNTMEAKINCSNVFKANNSDSFLTTKELQTNISFKGNFIASITPEFIKKRIVDSILGRIQLYNITLEMGPENLDIPRHQIQEEILDNITSKTAQRYLNETVQSNVVKSFKQNGNFDTLRVLVEKVIGIEELPESVRLAAIETYSYLVKTLDLSAEELQKAHNYIEPLFMDPVEDNVTTALKNTRRLISDKIKEFSI